MKTTKTPDIPVITCDLCKERFPDIETFDAHQRSEADRHCASNKFLKMPPLPKCLSAEALWCIGWRRSRPAKIWTKSPMPKMRAHRINEAETYQCLFCKSHFKDATVFKSHFIHTFLPIERCLDSDEMTALAYERGANGVWRQTLLTQILPSQVARLPTVRQELAEYDAGESVKRELAEVSAEYESRRFRESTKQPVAEEAKPVKAKPPTASITKVMFTALAAGLVEAASGDL
jgi:hypothetical protein